MEKKLRSKWLSVTIDLSSKVFTPQLPPFRTSIFTITAEPNHSRIERPWQTAIHRGGPGLLDGAGTPAWFLEASKALDELGFVACSPEAVWSLCLPCLFRMWLSFLRKEHIISHYVICLSMLTVFVSVGQLSFLATIVQHTIAYNNYIDRVW